MKLKRAMGRAEFLSRQEAKNARIKALEEEEAKKIPYEVHVLGGLSKRHHVFSFFHVLSHPLSLFLLGPETVTRGDYVENIKKK